MDGNGSVSHERAPNAPLRAEGRRGARIGLFIALGLGLAFAGLLGVRVKQAVAKREGVAKERVVVQEKGQKKEPPKSVRPTPTRWMPRVDVLGTIKPWRDADIGFETGGRVVRINASVGDRVESGRVLAVLDASRAAAQVGQAESQVKAAEANLALALDNAKRTDALAAQKAIPEAQAEQARQQVALARAQLDGAAASSRLAKSGAGLHSITAPFTGVITKAPTGIGSVVNPGVPLFHVEDTSHFRLSATVNEEDVPLVANGAKVHVVYREHTVVGKVIAIVPSLDQATRRAPVEIDVPNTNLIAWAFVRARIEGGAEVDAFRLPAIARRPGSQDEVVKVDRAGGKAVARIAKVSFAIDEDGTLVVQRGLTASDEIVLSPNPEVRDGDPIDAELVSAASVPASAAPPAGTAPQPAPHGK